MRQDHNAKIATDLLKMRLLAARLNVNVNIWHYRFMPLALGGVLAETWLEPFDDGYRYRTSRW